MQQHRPLLLLEEAEGLDQLPKVVSVDRTVIRQAKLLEEERWPQHALGCFFGAAHHVERMLASAPRQQPSGAVVQLAHMLVGHDLVQVLRDRPNVAVDRPLVVVEHHDQPPGLIGDVVQRLEGDAVGECGVAGQRNHMLCATGKIARHRHAQRRGKCGARVPCAVTVMLALCPQHESIQPTRLPHGIEAIHAAGQHLVHVGLMADVENKLVFGRFEDGVQGQRQLHHAEVRTKMSTGLRERDDQPLTNLLRQGFQLRHGQFL